MEFSPIDFEFLAALIQANELAVAVPEGRGPVHEIYDLDGFLTVFQADPKRRDQGARRERSDGTSRSAECLSGKI